MPACSLFSPGRSLPINICSVCGYTRNLHGAPERPAPDTSQLPLTHVLQQEQARGNAYQAILTELSVLLSAPSFDAIPGLVKELLAVKGFKTARLPADVVASHTVAPVRNPNHPHGPATDIPKTVYDKPLPEGE